MIPLLAALLLATAPARAAGPCTALIGGTVHLPSGVAEAASVVLEGDRVVAAGASLVGLEIQRAADGAPSGATWNRAPCVARSIAGKVVTPGLIEVGSRVGLVEVDLERATNDQEAGGDPIRAAMRVSDAYNPASTLIPVQRLGGITGAVISPSGGSIAGQSAFVVLAGERQSDAVVSPNVAMVANLTGASFAESLVALRELLADASLYGRNRAAWERNTLRSLVTGASALDLEALQPVVAGQVPLVIGANRASELEALIRFADETGVKLVIAGAAEGWRVADLLAAARIPVVVDPLVYGPGSFDQVFGRPENAARLVAAGVPVVISSFSTHNARTLRQVAGNAVRGGLPHDAAVRAITATPAQVFGLAGRGALTAGAMADLVVWSGDPLELGTRVEQVWIGGEEQPLTSRQTALRDAYRTLPGTPDAPLPLP